MTAAEMAEWDAYLERTTPSWDEAHDLHVYGEGDNVSLGVLTLAPFAPHFDVLPRDSERAALMVHDYEEARSG